MSAAEYDVNELVRLWNENVSASEIGRQLGVTKGVVIGRIRRLRESGVMLRALPRPPAPSKLTLWDLQPRSCRYIVGEAADGAALHCGQTQHYRSYCETHTRLCYRPATRTH